MKYSLRDMQRDFSEHLFSGDEKIYQHVNSSELVSNEMRMAIYRNAYYSRLVDILALDFEILKKLMGEDQFDEMAHRYVDTYPSQHFSLRVFGQNLHLFLQTYPNIETYLIEIAKFEWLLSTITDAADDKVLSVDEMSQIAPESWFVMQLKLHPSAHLESFHYNVGEIWGAIKDSQPAPEILFQETPQFWLFWRQEQEVYFTSLSDQEYLLLKNLQDGKKFGEICEELCQYLEEEQVIQFAASRLRSWVEAGVFSTVS